MQPALVLPWIMELVLKIQVLHLKLTSMLLNKDLPILKNALFLTSNGHPNKMSTWSASVIPTKKEM